MTRFPMLRRALGVFVLTTSLLAVGQVHAAPAQAACADVDVVFARGTGQPPGVGSVGAPFISSLKAALPGRSVSTYAVVWSASQGQGDVGTGATDMSRHVKAVAAACPRTRFVLGGYSQGASVTSVAVGVKTSLGTGTPIPSSLSGRVAAVVVFGNPLGLSGRTIASATTDYRYKAKDYCNRGDPICGFGFSMTPHYAYVTNGSTAKGATYAANLYLASR